MAIIFAEVDDLGEKWYIQKKTMITRKSEDEKWCKSYGGEFFHQKYKVTFQIYII